MAFRIQLVGGPSWIDSIHVDVTGVAAPTATRDEISRMTQTLLAERFNLAVHREQREMPVYSLVVARDDGRLGPSMQPATTDCAAAAAKGGAAPQLPCGQLLCTTRMSPTTHQRRRYDDGAACATTQRHRCACGNGRDESDRHLRPAALVRTERPLPPCAPAADPNLPSIFAALQEQLGLKLNARRGKVDVLVIDRIDPPKENSATSVPRRGPCAPHRARPGRP